MYADNVDLSSNECKQNFSKFVENLHNNVTQDICYYLEIGTRGQDIKTNWIEARNMVITASNMRLVCKRTKPEHDKLVCSFRGYRQQPLGIKVFNMAKNIGNRH